MQVDLVDRPRVPRTGQQVAIRVEVDRVEVEPVPGLVRRRRQRNVAVAVRHVIGGVPLKQYLAGTYVDLLHEVFRDLLVGRTSDSGEVGRRFAKYWDKRGIPWG